MSVRCFLRLGFTVRFLIGILLHAVVSGMVRESANVKVSVWSRCGVCG